MVKRKLNLPPPIAKAFVKDMEAFFAEEDGHRRDAIAARQVRALREFRGPGDELLKLSDVKRMFILMQNKK